MLPEPAPAPVAVFVHVHYPDIWDEMSALVAERMRIPFTLVVTTPHPEAAIALPATPLMASSRILPTENRGRDIRPFLLALQGTTGFEIGLKLHTKKSPQREDGAQWRSEVLDALLPPPPGAADIAARLAADPRIGIAAPAGFCLSVAPWVLVNEAGMARVMATMGAPLSAEQLDDCFFAAGSMFWFRRQAIAGLADPRVLSLFQPETGQLDATIAHAMERLFPVEARRTGHVSLAVPALQQSLPSMDEAQLLALARRHADIPNRYFPAPNVPAGTLPARTGMLARLVRAAGPVRYDR